MIRLTTAILRRLAWLNFSIAGTALILVLGVAFSKTSAFVAQNARAYNVGAAAPMSAGMDMAKISDDPPVTAGDGNTVTIQNFSFGPGTLTVSAGTTVNWINSDSVTHTVTAMDGSFDSSNLAPGQQFSFTFATPGTYSYHCSIHPFMTGQVVVQ